MSPEQTSDTVCMLSNLSGRIRNTTLPLSHGFMPLFEAVVNSIHAIEDAELSNTQGQILIEIIRAPLQGQLSFDIKKTRGPDSEADIIGFKITDNGIGFTDRNLTSFKELDSDYKADRNCRGIGRLMWLKAFDKAEINSFYFDENKKLKQRIFSFSKNLGVSSLKELDVEKDKTRKTIVSLINFAAKYRKASAKTTDAIAKALINHCCWYFLRPGGCPEIKLLDNGEIISLDNVFEEFMGANQETSNEQIKISGHEFELTHIRLRSQSQALSHTIFYCAGERLVQQESLKGKIPGLFDVVADDSGTFVYACYVASPYLNEKVSAERTGFNIQDSEDLYSSEITFDEIRNTIYKKATAHLGEALQQNREKSQERLNNYINNRAPRYKSVIRHLSEVENYIDPNISDKELELFLHRHLTDLEKSLIDEGHKLMHPQENELAIAYQKRINDYLKKAKDIKESDLANYIFHRRIILDILRQALKKDENGKYVKEEIIHQLIMPMQKDSEEIHLDDANLWVIDEKLAFHEYLASDKPLSSMPIIDSDSNKEPDLCALTVYDNPLLVNPPEQKILAALTIVELKRPMRNDARPGEDTDPIEQALGYLKRIKTGNVKTKDGRPIVDNGQIPSFCYIICDLTDKIRDSATNKALTPTEDRLGYFGYNPNYKAYIEVISFDKLLDNATKRNEVFFQKLGLPTS